MAPEEKIANNAVKEQQNIPKVPLEEQHVAPKRKGPLISKRVTDHLANERTFLAWVRTGLAIIAFGFVVERFGLVLRELGLKLIERPIVTGHYSTVIGITLTLLGSFVMIVALANFLQARRSIDQEHFHPHAGFAVLLTIITCLIGIILAIYLYFTT
jgi:putative membrane protein